MHGDIAQFLVFRPTNWQLDNGFEKTTRDLKLDLPDYARISIAFEVSEIVDIAESTTTPGGFDISERRLDRSYVKDYDQLPGERPIQWPQRFDLSNWGLFGARVDRQRVGSAAVAFDTPGLDMLDGRRDLAVLWDIRVAPQARGRGVGTKLFRTVERWAGIEVGKKV